MRAVIVLGIVGFLSAALLVTINNLTTEPIAKAKENAKTKALQEIFDFEFSMQDVKQEKTDDAVLYEIKPGGELKAIAVETFTDKGYSGRIDILVGVTPDCKVTGYKVLTHKETPGLGDKITKDKFKKQFVGAGLEQNWSVKKDGGFVDSITAATISSRAMAEAVHKGLLLVSDKWGCKK